MMKNKLLAFAFLAGFSFSVSKLNAQNVAINGTGAAPAASAMLDVSSTTMGSLIPRMTSVQRTAIAAPATGLEVYDTTTGSFWYYNGVIWVQEVNSGTGWLLAGNTLSGSEILGSLNAQPVRFYANNTERMRLLSGGNFLIGSTVAVSGSDLMEAVGSATFPYPINAFTGVANAIGVYSTATGGGSALGIYGASNGATGFGMEAVNTNAGGSGFLAVGSNVAAFYIPGSGGSFNGPTGAAGLATSATGMGIDGRNSNVNGTGVIGTGNNLAGTYLASGSGGAFKGVLDGAFIYNTSLGVSEAAYTSNGGVICRVNYWSGVTQYKIIGTGSVSCVIPDTAGVPHVMHCAESPEIYFTDYGQGQLVNGKAHITLDPNIAKNVAINEKHPLRAYVQLEGDCNGVYITNKTDTSFDVVELHGGHSNVSFQWNVVCNAADMTLSNGRESKNADVRFEPAPADKVIVDTEPVKATAPVVKKEPK